MTDFTKLASFFDSFQKDHPDYDAVCFIKQKIAAELAADSIVNNGESDDLTDTDITMNTPEQKEQKNQEGSIMDGAFQEMDIKNKLDEQKEQVVISKTDKPQPEAAAKEHFGDNALNRKEAASMYSLLKDLRKNVLPPASAQTASMLKDKMEEDFFNEKEATTLYDVVRNKLKK